MTLDELDEALLCWGADLDRWPDGAANAARNLLAADRKAQALYSEMTRFDAVLGMATMVAADSTIAARAQRALQERRDANLWSLLPIKSILGFGSLAGVGSAVVAWTGPVSVNVGALLIMAIGGGAP